jgi:D-inositol-3-phosphate glycosyltransferase
VIPNPISGKLLKAALRFEKNGNAERIVLYTGRLAPVKGVETLLEAARLVHGKDRSVTFVLAGPWQMPNSPEAYGLQLNRKSDFGVQWIGSQTQDELISWYKRAALFVMPSYFESFGISAVEAIAFGLPVVATDTSGLAEMLNGNGSGSLVAKGNAKAFAQKIISSLSSPRERREKADQLRALAQKFSPEHIAAETMKVYEAVYAERAALKSTQSA